MAIAVARARVVSDGSDMDGRSGQEEGAEAPVFSDAFRAEFAELLRWRRDVRRFRADPLPAGTLERLVGLACLSPSVGLSEPWRFVTVDDPARRAAIRGCFARSNADAAASYAGEQAARYRALKLAGLDEAPCHLAVFADPGTAQGSGLGSRSMPETLAYSAVMAVHTLWLAARAEGLGLGWVSIIDAADVAAILDVRAEWRLIGYFCLGYPARPDSRPELERSGWEARRPPACRLHRR